MWKILKYQCPLPPARPDMLQHENEGEGFVARNPGQLITSVNNIVFHTTGGNISILHWVSINTKIAFLRLFEIVLGTLAFFAASGLLYGAFVESRAWIVVKKQTKLLKCQIGCVEN